MSNIVVEEESGVETADFKVQKERKLQLWLFVFLVNNLLSHILYMRVRWIRKTYCVIQRIRRVRRLKAVLSINCIYWFGFMIGKIRLLNYRMRERIWPLVFGLASTICLILRISAKWAKLLWSYSPKIIIVGNKVQREVEKRRSTYKDREERSVCGFFWKEELLWNL